MTKLDDTPGAPGGHHVKPLKPGEKPDQLEKTAPSESRQEALVDEALGESFPASDPPTPKRIA